MLTFLGAPFHFNHLMSHRCLEAIIKYLKFTSTPALAYKATFHCVEELVNAFNKHTQRAFVSSWIACLDESMSMSMWTSQWTSPGWKFVPHKPHPFGNEYHSMCCGLSDIMYSIELVEGKDWLHQSPPKILKKRGGQPDYFHDFVNQSCTQVELLSWLQASVYYRLL